MIKVEMQTNKLKCMKAKLKDGTEIEISGEVLEAGAKVTTAEGGQAMEGSYELETGETISVDATGTITEVTPKAEEEQAAAPVELSENDVTKIVEAMKPMIADMIKEAMGTKEEGMAKEEVATEMKKVSEAFEAKIKALEKTIKETPASQSFTNTPTAPALPKTKKELMADAIAEMRKTNN